MRAYRVANHAGVVSLGRTFVSAIRTLLLKERRACAVAGILMTRRRLP
jgi:hypothetical protein